MPVNQLSVVIETVLLETEGPDLVLARDQVGTPYLCLLVARDADTDHFLVQQISSDRLAALRSGQIDLRTTVQHPEMGQHYHGSYAEREGRPVISLEVIHDVPERWFPADGFLLSDFAEQVSDEQVVRDAISKHAAVVVCHLDPPEARGTTAKINADRLAECMLGFQSLVKYALRRSVSGTAAARRFGLNPDSHVLQVYAFSPGSFQIHLESKYRADLTGASAIGVAMSKIDELMEVLQMPPERALPVIRENRGHIISAYRHLLRFVSEEGAPFEYRWADPGMSSGRGSRVAPAAAAAVCGLLDSRTELAAEEVTFNGRFLRVAADRLTWTVVEDDERTRQGVVHESAPDVLRGVIVETQVYKLTCEERLEESGTGREILKLFLMTADPVR
jgi:hypothetical protein